MKLGAATRTSIGIAIAAVLSSVAVVATRRAATTSETEAREKSLLSLWREDEVSRLSLGTKPRVVIEHKPGTDGEPSWLLTEPISEPAEQEAVESLVSELGFATPVHRTDQPEAAIGVGATSPKIEIWVGPAHYELLLGSAVAAPAGARYLSLRAEGAPGAGSFVVNKETAALFESNLDSLRVKDLWPFTEGVNGLEIEGPGVKLSLEKPPGASFVMAGGARVSRAATEPLIAGLARLKALRFLEQAPAEAALAAAPRFHVKARGAKQPALDLELGGDCPGQPELTVVVRRAPRPLFACTERSILERLAPNPQALVDRLTFATRSDEVEELTIERSGKRLVLTRKGERFLMRQPSEAEVTLDAGNLRLRQIVEASGEAVTSPDLGELGFEPPLGKVTIVSPGNGKAYEEVLELGRYGQRGTLYVRRQDGVVLLLDHEGARAFAIDSTLLRDPKLLQFSASELVSLGLSQPEPQRVVRGSSGSLELAAPKGFELDGGLATDLAFALGALNAVRFVADADDGSYGLGRPIARAHIEFAAGDAGSRSRELLISEPTSGGNYARFSDDPTVFVVERELVERLSTLLVNRSEFLVDPISVTRLTLVHDGKRVVLAEQGGKLVALAPANLPQEQPRLLLDTLAGLRADAALHTGPARAAEGFAPPSLEVEVQRRGAPALAFSIGASDSYRGLRVMYARARKVDATFVIARSKLDPLFDVFE